MKKIDYICEKFATSSKIMNSKYQKEAQQECSNDATCLMFYKKYGLLGIGMPFRSCDGSYQVKARKGTVLYKKGN